MSKKSRFKKWLMQNKENTELKEASKEESKEQKKETANEPRESKHNFLMNIYDKHYKKLLIIPLALLLFALVIIGITYMQTGEFFSKSVDIKGGISLTIPLEKYIDTNEMQKGILSDFKKNDVSIRSLSVTGKQTGIVIDIDIDLNDKENVEKLMELLRNKLNLALNKGEYTITGIGSSLGRSFFRETLIAVLIAFLSMSIVVFIYFKVPIPSLTVILCAFSDILITLAVVDFMGMKISTAGIAAFLMLIGYSVDTDILLTTRVLKREGTILEGTISALKTGLTMTLTTIAAVSVSLIFTQSDVLKQIMTIIFIGLLADIIFTWIQNVSLLRWYLEKHGN